MSGETGWPALDVVVDAYGLRRGAPTSGQTTGGTHAANSYHYRGLARDYGVLEADADGISRLFNGLAQTRPDLIPEKFGSDGEGYSQGAPFQAEGHTGDHTHVAIGRGVTSDDLLAALGGSPGVTAPPGATKAGAAPGVSEAGLRRFFLVLGGALMFVVGALFLGQEVGAVKTAAKVAKVALAP